MIVEPWQIPVIVMTALAVPVWLYYWVKGHLIPQTTSTGEEVPQAGVSRDSSPADLQGSRLDTSPRPQSPARAWARTAAFGVLTLLLVVIFGWALGPTTADKLVTGASAVSAIVAASLTLQSIMIQRSEQPRAGPRQPSSTESADDAGTS
jgi:peptidoglycan/LPS O-acetylase OafA/YrhL